MASQRFDRRLDVASGRQRAWAVLTDVQELTSWVRIVHETVEIDRLNTYTAVLQDRLGPFALKAVLDISVTVPEELTEIRVQASGRDRAVDTKLTVDATLRLGDAAGGGTTVQVDGEYQVTGKVAAMGAGVIRKKADQILADFVTNAARVLDN